MGGGGEAKGFVGFVSQNRQCGRARDAPSLGPAVSRAPQSHDSAAWQSSPRTAIVCRLLLSGGVRDGQLSNLFQLHSLVLTLIPLNPLSLADARDDTRQVPVQPDQFHNVLLCQAPRPRYDLVQQMFFPVTDWLVVCIESSIEVFIFGPALFPVRILDQHPF